MKILYEYILNPKKTITIYSKKNIITISLFALALLAFIFVGRISKGLIIQELFWLITLSLVILLQSFIIDFIAQILGYSSQSYRLFQWHCLSYLPALLLPPLHIILAKFHAAFFSIFLWLVLLTILFLQIITIKHLYQSNTKDIFLIFAIPILVIIGLSFLFVSFIGVLINTSL